MRIGQGFDSHRFAEGRKLILAGVAVDYPLGLDGHSDADVVCHAVVDALLGAAGLGDIGMHFPDSDPTFRDASSVEMLETICNAVYEMGFRIINIDVTIFAQAPKIGPYRADMVGNLAAATRVEPERINVKAKTAEGLGFLGRVEGVAAAAVVLLEEGEPESS